LSSITFDELFLDNSSVEPFYIKVTNSDTGFSGET